MKHRVVIGVLGTTLDKRGKRENRWTKWRPTVGLCQQPDFSGRFTGAAASVTQRGDGTAGGRGYRRGVTRYAGHASDR
nr:RNA repair transcriptional activator RtcR family protein [Pectobacterium colocasium]